MGKVRSSRDDAVALQVHHLESTGSALADDVIQKSEIIKSYFMDTKAGQSPLPLPLSASQRGALPQTTPPPRAAPWPTGCPP